MSTLDPTPNFGLHQWKGGAPGIGDPISRAEFNENFATIDDLARAVPCTSSTRPASPFAGMVIYETDTGKALVRNTANTAWLAISGVTVATTTGAVSSPSPGQIVHESNTRITYFRDSSGGGSWRTFGVPIVNDPTDITGPTNGQIVWSFTGFGLYVYKSSTSTWTPLTHDQYTTFRLGTSTSISNSAWTSVPFATAGEGSSQGISTSDNITWTFDQPGTWSVKVMLGNNSNQGFIGALIRGSNVDPFNVANSETYAFDSAPAIQTVAGMTLAADIRVATGGTRTVRCSCISTSASFSFPSSGPMRPRISFKWSPL